jgi:hypothetical protein
MLPYTDEAAVGDIVKADSNGRLVEFMQFQNVVKKIDLYRSLLLPWTKATQTRTFTSQLSLLHALIHRRVRLYYLNIFRHLFFISFSAVCHGLQNLVLGRTPVTSSECYTSNPTGNRYLVDGDYFQLETTSNRVCPGDLRYWHSCSENPITAQVDFAERSTVYKVTLFPRCNCCADQMAGAWAEILVNGVWTRCGSGVTTTVNLSPAGFFTFTCNLVGTSVRISSNTGTLTIAELQVWGYGDSCSRRSAYTYDMDFGAVTVTSPGSIWQSRDVRSGNFAETSTVTWVQASTDVAAGSFVLLTYQYLIGYGDWGSETGPSFSVYIGSTQIGSSIQYSDYPYDTTCSTCHSPPRTLALWVSSALSGQIKTFNNGQGRNSHIKMLKITVIPGGSGACPTPSASTGYVLASGCSTSANSQCAVTCATGCSGM